LKHIVVLMQENRSYDDYFGALHRRSPTSTTNGPARTPRSPTAA
jgi:phospholipase C